MMAVLKGGSSGNIAEVDSENRLNTFSITEREDRHINIAHQAVWSIYFTVTPTGANDDFFYLRNDGTKDLFITDVRISSSAVTKVLYKHVSGTVGGGTVIVPVNRTLGASNVPTATIEQGVSLTGLVDVGIFDFEDCAVADTLYELQSESNIIVPQGKAVAFERIAATGAITCVVSLVESE